MAYADMSKFNRSVIATKLIPPVHHFGLVDRPRLMAMLERPAPRKLTLITAPAGFGKTTLLGQWVEYLTASDYACCWLSLDQGDRSTPRFIAHFLAAIRTVLPQFGSSLSRGFDSAEVVDVAHFLPQFVSEISATEKNIVLCLDDFHYVKDRSIHEFIELIINLSPSNFSLIIASRVQPDFPLGRLRVADELIEVLAQDLRFDLRETTELLRRIQDVKLDAVQLERLQSRSEGWVAGLQLASHSLRSATRPSDYFETFSGNLRDIADYMAVDVLDQQSQAIRDFLLRTSILDRFTSDLCNAVCRGTESAACLDELERKHLFVVPLDHERKWYRYHHLFQEFLLGQLRRRYPGEVTALYRRAAEWLTNEKSTSEAVEYALLSGDMSLAMQLVEQQAEEELLAGRMPRVNAWVNRIPSEIRDSRPELLIAKCTALYHMNRPDEAEETLGLLRATAPRDCGVEVGEDWKRGKRVPMADHVRMIEAGIAIARDDIHGIMRALEQPIRNSGNFELATANNIKGYALAELSRFAEARRCLQHARRYHQLNESPFGIVYADCFLGLIDIAMGNLRDCFGRFEEYNIDGARAEDNYSLPVAAVMRGIVLYEWNRIDAALPLLKQNLPTIEQVGHVKLLVLGYLALSKIYGANNDSASAGRYFDHALALGIQRQPAHRRLQLLLETERVRYLLANDRLPDAAEVSASVGVRLEEVPCANDWDWDSEQFVQSIMWCNLQQYSASAESCLPTLALLAEQAKRSKRFRWEIRCNIMSASIRFQLGDQDAAARHMCAAVSRAEPNGHLRSFVDEGLPCFAVIRWLDEHGTGDDSVKVRAFVGRLRSAFQQVGHPEEAVRAPLGMVLDPLGEKELAILNLVAAGLPNRAIADELCVSENTVKWHLKNIFGKLGVSSRTSAVIVVQRLGLI